MQKTVLIVEDNFLIADDLKTSLEELGWQIVGPAPDVRTSLALLENCRPSVAVLDMQLGYELVTAVAQRLKDLDVPFVMSTGCIDPVSLGGDVFTDCVNVGKPATVSTLNTHLLSAAASKGPGLRKLTSAN